MIFAFALRPTWTLQRVAAPPVQVHGEGVGGGVNPSPKGKKGRRKRNTLNHLRPEGWWDFNVVSTRQAAQYFVSVRSSPVPRTLKTTLKLGGGGRQTHGRLAAERYFTFAFQARYPSSLVSPLQNISA